MTALLACSRMGCECGRVVASPSWDQQVLASTPVTPWHWLSEPAYTTKTLDCFVRARLAGSKSLVPDL